MSPALSGLSKGISHFPSVPTGVCLMVPFGKVTVTVAPGTPVPLTTVSLLLTGATPGL